MTVLAFDCAVSGRALPSCATACVWPGSVKAAATGRLLPAIETVLADAASTGALALLAVTIGPAASPACAWASPPARGLAVGLAVPLAGITTTAVLLAQTASRDRLVIAAIDSRLGDWFCAIGEGDDAVRGLVGARSRCPPRRPPCLVVGIGPRRLATNFRGRRQSTRSPRKQPPILSRSPLGRRLSEADVWRARNAEEGLPPRSTCAASTSPCRMARRTVD